MRNKKGVSLIVLIITIIVIIILAAVVILTLSKNNPIDSAKEARFKEDVRTYQDELNMYISKEYQQLAGQRDHKITATGYEKDSTNDEYNNSVYRYLGSFKKKYENKIAIENDEIVYIGRDKKEREWTNNIVKMNPMLTVKYVYENGEEAAQTYEEVITDGAYEVDSPIIEGYEPDHYTVSDTINKDTEITVTYYPWSEGLAYEELDDGTYTVAGIGTFTGENLVIPAKYNDKDITQIKRNAFRNNNIIKNIAIPNNVKFVNQDAFAGCTNLKYLYIDSMNIALGAFVSCTKLNIIELGSRVQSISYNGFQNCVNLDTVIIHSEILSSINYTKFIGCTNFRNILVNKNNSKFKAIDGVLYSKDGKKLYLYPEGKKGEFTILSSVEEINEQSCRHNLNLHKIELLETVQVVSQSAFESCINIEYVKINSRSIGLNAFISCTNLKTLYIEKNVKSISQGAFRYCSALEQINYSGTIEEWNNIYKGSGWNENSNITKIICSDGEVDI